MRVVKEINTSQGKITIFHWNNRYLIKLEQGPFEQTYKLAEMDVTGEEEVVQLIDEEFLKKAMIIFHDMAENLLLARTRLES